ncbi:MAG: hypothetical protein EOO90_06355 [Pedobacter sp.]|nr:MAG: hypothetical protein EOO90_06355 [Pedobacter sp.]
MIVKIFKPKAVFAAVRYNTSKVDKNKGELMVVANFGPLQSFRDLRPQDYINYLKMVSARNRTTKLPQFHAVISAKSRSFDKHVLSALAQDWLREMGYGDQPYLLVYHKDTDHSHIHMVSTRIDKQGKRIDSGFEHMRAISHLNKLIGVDEVLKAKTDLEKAMGYNFTTKPQLMMVLEEMGYKLLEKHGSLQLIKYGRNLTQLQLSDVKQRLETNVLDRKRASQLTAIFARYRSQYSSALRRETLPLPGGLSRNLDSYHSDLSDFLREKFGLTLMFHSRDNKPVYGYSIIDHAEKNVFKGSEVMDLEILLEPVQLQKAELEHTTQPADLELTEPIWQEDTLEESSDSRYEQGFAAHEPDVHISIADDIDDEAILGRNRRRQRKARTNTR